MRLKKKKKNWSDVDQITVTNEPEIHFHKYTLFPFLFFHIIQPDFVIENNTYQVI